MGLYPDYITLADGQAYVEDTTGTHDADIAAAITTASRSIDDFTNRQFGKADSASERLYTAWPDLDRGLWVVDVFDFMTTTNLVVMVGNTVTTDFRKEPINAASDGKPWTRLTFDPAASVVPRGTEYEVSVTAIWGWTSVPVAVTQACRLQMSRLLKRKESPYGVAGSPELGSEMRLLSRVDPDVAVSLRGYVRPRGVA